MLQLNHLMLKSNSLEQTSEGLQTRNSFSSGYQSYMHNPTFFLLSPIFPTEPRSSIYHTRRVSSYSLETLLVTPLGFKPGTF